MSPTQSLWLAGLLAVVGSVSFAWFVRLPLPFDGFAAFAGGALAFVGSLTLLSWFPRRWVWTEAEQLRHAFQARHGVTEYAAGSALEAITQAHQRANTLRAAATSMRDDVAARVDAVADRMDQAAREIFYSPDRQRDLRAVLIRSELIEDAATAHAKLRKREHSETEDASRQKLLAALDALTAAFDQTDLLAARGLLAEVEAASEVAETLLAPRRKMHSSGLT